MNNNIRKFMRRINRKVQVISSKVIDNEFKEKLAVNHIPYNISYKNGINIIETKGFKLKNPILTTEHGDINAKITNKGSNWVFEFKLDDIPHIDSISSKVVINDEGEEYNFSTFDLDKKNNYNTTYNIQYTDEFIYYFRNTASKNGRLVFQKKLRSYFETAEYERIIEEEYEKTIGCKMDTIVFFEKFGMKYEESASKVFEKVAHLPNTYFVLDRTSEQYDDLKVKYGDQIISPDERKFLNVIFRSKFLIGTEVPFHMVTLRTPYIRFRQELTDTSKHKFIFLQHGVMYALSMKPASRNSFKKNGIHSPFRVVVSSETEARHFMRLGSYKRKDLWKTGLATFDGKRINKDADKITVMLTWRPWDEQKDNFEDTTYYQAVKKIVNKIEDKDKLQLVLHPKVLETINENNELLKYKFDGMINDALNNTKVLISDYSSVTFDAFYRGCNVIFWWQEKDYCLFEYKNRLMLNENNIFGDIVYDNEVINEVIDINKNSDQHEEYLENYQKIVEFHDDQNTNRIVEFLFTETVFNDSFDFECLKEIRTKIKHIAPMTGIYGVVKMAYLGQLSKERLKYLKDEYEDEFIVNFITELVLEDDKIKKDIIVEKYANEIEDYVENLQIIRKEMRENMVFEPIEHPQAIIKERNKSSSSNK